MTRTTLTKILILVILVFVVCLPEFFSLYRVSKVTFVCLPHHCGRPGSRDAGNQRVGLCERSAQKCERDCERDRRFSLTDEESGRGTWFICEADVDMAELHNNITSSAPQVHLELWAELQLSGADNLNLTLYGHNNNRSLYLQPPDDQDEEEGEEEGGGRGRGHGAFYCCLPDVPPTSGPSANRSRCLLWLANQTLAAATDKDWLPWKRTPRAEWACTLRVLWLALLCALLLTVFTSVLRSSCLSTHSRKNDLVKPVYNFTHLQLNDGEEVMETTAPTDVPLSRRSSEWAELSTIKEAESRDNLETLLDGNTNHCRSSH